MTRIPALYLAPWVDYGGTDKGTIDWFRFIDRERFDPLLATTQLSANRRLGEVLPYASEVWPLPDLMAGAAMPRFLFDLIDSRGVEVLHIMNSRLGYDLLPDLGCLPRPPQVVVQLHVEEADRSGYVRYVTTRYGNLVDAFSVTSEHLAEAVHGYGVPRGKIHVIHTGVDGARELSPDRVAPIEGLDPGLVHVLYPGRLVEQKDPLLMLRVVEALGDLPFQLHVVGDGPLEDEVRHRAPGNVRFHPPTPGLARWFRACDLLLMTSVFEGVPYVAYEAMAMGVPVIAPALPGNVEVIGPDGVLVEPRDDVDAYAAALRRLVTGEVERRSLGERARARMLAELPLERMAAEHEALYDGLVVARPAPPEAAAPAVPVRETREPLRFPARPLHERPLVSVLIPCFNHGRFLPACVESVKGQTYPAVEIVVVDDGSTDPETIEVLGALERDGVIVERLEENSGPSVARNRALARATGRYVLPVDADNLLVPEAVEHMVDQLAAAGETVGFIYPSLRYFGNRDDWFAAPDYNLFSLLRGNYCDTCSLFDADVFRAGVRFEEEIRLGHEDWDLMLQVAERGVRGEPARDRTVLYRKWGFNRSDAVEYASDLPSTAIRARSPLVAREMTIKAAWAPAVSIVALAEIDPGSESGGRIARLLALQSAIDCELVARFDGEWPTSEPAPAVRRLPPELSETPAHAAADGLDAARGRVTVMTSGTGSDLLADRAFTEKVLRSLDRLDAMGRAPDAIALVDAPRHPFALLGREEGAGLAPHAVAWRIEVEDALPDVLPMWTEAPVASLVRLMNGAGARIAWHAHPGPPAPHTGGEVRWFPRRREPGDPNRGAERRMRLAADPQVPALPYGSVRRWALTPTWTRPQTVPLCRHREAGGERRMCTNSQASPPGWILEWDLGRTCACPLEGTARLLPGLRVAPRSEGADGEHLGFVEEAAFPQLEPLLAGIHRPTGERVLVCGEDDPLLPDVEIEATLGFIEPYPIQPLRRQPEARPFGTIGLTRSVDAAGWRHRYGLGGFAAGQAAGELGALATEPWPGTLPVWLVDDWLVTEPPPGTALVPAGAGTPGRVPAKAAARWALAPAAWRGFSEPMPKARAIARRSARAAGALRGGPQLAAPSPPAGAAPAGHLWAGPAPGRRELWRARHAVTGDVLLSQFRDESADMGYREPALVGYMLDQAPLTGSFELADVAIPWASRFGMAARRG